VSGVWRRAIAILSLLGAVAVLAAPAWLPALYWVQGERALAAIERENARLRDAAGERTALEAELERLRSSGATGLLSGATPALAGSRLQGLLVELARTTGGSVESAQALPPRPLDEYVEIGLRLVFTTTHRGLRDLLHAIETGPPSLLVAELQVVPRRDGPRDDAPDTLRVSLVATGLMAGESAPRPDRTGAG
jgi:hypothetical protein